MKKGILITGAMGGLGKALVEAALELGDVDQVVAVDRNKDILEHYKGYDRIVGLEMDVGSQKSIRAVCEQLHYLGISIKYLINNAGIARFFPVSEADEKQLDEIIRVNTYGPVLTVSAFLNDLVENRGRIVQISSDSVRMSGLFQPYASTKVAMESFSIAMRQELSLQGIQLVLLRPGAIKTNLLNEIRQAETGENSIYREVFKQFSKIAQKEVGNIAEPGDVAKVVMKAIKAKKPKLVYSINKNSKISFLVKFPHRWIDYLVKKTILKNNT